MVGDRASRQQNRVRFKPPVARETRRRRIRHRVVEARNSRTGLKGPIAQVIARIAKDRIVTVDMPIFDVGGGYWCQRSRQQRYHANWATRGWSHPERLDLQCVTVDSLYERAGQPFE